MDDIRPYILVNIASTADGKIDTVARRGAQISSPKDWERVDGLRASCDAIMVGGKTFQDEDPRLLVKSAALRSQRVKLGQPENPIKIAVVSQTVLREKSRFLNEGNTGVIVFTTQRTPSSLLSELEGAGAEVVVLGETRVDLAAAMRVLHARGIRRLMVEGGGTLISELFRLGFVDELYVYIAPLIFGGASAPTMADGPGIEREAAIRLRLESVAAQPDGGILIHYFINNTEKGA
jgi:2,5-diamino-6-(ribosylamino)-4(3H)-pyrimidinone 5'-phosphate reductase